MVEIEFDFLQRKTVIQANFEESFQNVVDKYKQKSSYVSDSVCYLYNGTIISNLEIQIKNLINNADRRNKKMKLLVYSIDQDERDNTQAIIQSKEIICPDCKEP